MVTTFKLISTSITCYHCVCVGGVWGVVRMCVRAQSLSRVRGFCNPIDCSPPSSSGHGISQARILEWVAISSSRGSSPPRD